MNTDTLNDHIIPELVLHLCLLFYYQRKHFSFLIDIDGEKEKGALADSKISDDKRTVSLCGYAGTALGKIEIHSLSETVCRTDMRLQTKIGREDDAIKYFYVAISGDNLY